jgi:hypothetical protein
VRELPLALHNAGGQIVHQEARRRGHAEVNRARGAAGLQGLLDRADSGDQRTGNIREQATGLGGLTAAGVGLDQLHSEVVLQGVNLLPHRRPRQAQRVRRCRQAPQPDRLAKAPQLLERDLLVRPPWTTWHQHG